MSQCGIQTCPRVYSCGSRYKYWQGDCGKKYRALVYSDIDQAALQTKINTQWKAFSDYFNLGNVTLQGLTALGLLVQNSGVFTLFPNSTNGLATTQGAIGSASGNILIVGSLQALIAAGYTVQTFNVKIAAYLGNWNYLVNGTITYTNRAGQSLVYSVNYTMTTDCNLSVKWNDFTSNLPTA